MRKIFLALTGAAVALSAAPAIAKDKTYVCTKWNDGVCVSTKRVQTYAYTPVGGVPQPVVTYYKLDSNGRYVYSDGYVYVVDPATYAVTRVIDTLGH